VIFIGNEPRIAAFDGFGYDDAARYCYGGTMSDPATEKPIPIEQDPMFRNIGRQRLGCLVRMLLMGLVSAGLLTALGFWLVKDTIRDRETVGKMFAADFSADIPEHFFPYTYSKFFGTYLIVFWSEEHKLDEHRTSSVFGLHWLSDWQGKTVAEVEAQALQELEARLDRNEFRTTDYAAVKVQHGDETVIVHRFRGLTRLDESFAEAVTCYRYMMGPDGPVQVMTLGLTETFSEEDQLALVASAKTKNPLNP
jgi:hypothetical protein